MCCQRQSRSETRPPTRPAAQSHDRELAGAALFPPSAVLRSTPTEAAGSSLLSSAQRVPIAPTPRRQPWPLPNAISPSIRTIVKTHDFGLRESMRPAACSCPGPRGHPSIPSVPTLSRPPAAFFSLILPINLRLALCCPTLVPIAPRPAREWLASITATIGTRSDCHQAWGAALGMLVAMPAFRFPRRFQLRDSHQRGILGKPGAL